MPFESLALTRKPVTLLLKGPSGSGKTYKAAQFPAALIFNFDNNLSCLRKLAPDQQKNVRVANPRADAAGKPVKAENVWARFIVLLEEALADASVKTIVIDSMTTLSEALMDKVLGSGAPDKKIEIQHWGELDRFLKWLGEDLLCANDLDKTIVVLAHEQAETDATGAISGYIINFGGKKIKRSYELYFSDCWRSFTKVTGTEVKYCVRTVPDVLFNAKCSLDLPPVFEWDKEAANVMKQL